MAIGNTTGSGASVWSVIREEHLEYRQGSSDKVYNVFLYQDQFASFRLEATYGPRNGTLISAPKDVKSDPYNEFDKLVRSKTSKGYVTNPSFAGTTHQAQPASQPASTGPQRFGHDVQLLNEITEDEALTYIESPFWVMQQKFDGERRPVSVVLTGSGKVHETIGGNRKGDVVDLPESVSGGLKSLSLTETTIFDAEVVGDDLFIIDLLKSGSANMKENALQARLLALDEIELACTNKKSNIHFAETYWTAAEKREAFARIKVQGKEGVVFKLRNAPYEAGRPNSGGVALKCKFWKSVTVVVSAVNAGRSVGISIYDGSDMPDGYNLVDVGNVTISANFDMPKVGDLVEVRYLYVTNIGGSLYQPVYKGLRTDKDYADSVKHLHYKPASQKLAA